MFNKKMLATSMAIALTTGGLVAQSHAIEVANDDLGQVLLGPVFFVENGYKTDITVTNTRTDAAVKAKVVFRSHVKSQEILDFIIYLTPGDVWRGQVVTGDDGEGHITSSDDSMRDATDSGWADVTPVDQPFFSHGLTDSTDSTTFGHFEVIGTYAAADTYSVGSDAYVVEQGMTKDDLKAIFDAADANLIGRNTDYTHCGPAMLNTDNTVSSVAACAMQLLGEVRIGNETDPNRASMRMTALGADSAAVENSEAYAEMAGYVITNPFYNATTAAESGLGTDFGVVGNACAADNIACIEMALAGEQTSNEYEDDADEMTHAVLMFPTKYRHWADATACGAGSAILADGEYTPPFQPTTIGEMQYKYTSLDNSEMGAQATGSPFSGGTVSATLDFPNEVNYHVPNAYADSGWAYYSWLPYAGCDYAGAPVIGYTFKFRPGATSTETMLQRAATSSYVD